MLSAVVTRLSEQYLAKRYEQGRTEARAETLAEVEKWNQRRLQRLKASRSMSHCHQLPSSPHRGRLLW